MNYLKKKKKAMLNYVSNRFPSEYQEVDYICQRSGVVYINTGYRFTTNSDMRLVYLMPSTRGNIAFASDYGYQQISSTQSQILASTRYNFDLPYNTKYDLKFGANGVWANGNQLMLSSMARDTNIQMQLCAYNNGWSSNVHIYLCQFYENDKLVKNLIPCYRKSDNVIGMYDTINKEFIAKAGSGVMTYGNEV